MEFLLKKASATLYTTIEYTDVRFENQFNLPDWVKTRVDIDKWGDKILYIEIDNLEDLLKLGKEINHRMIIDADDNEILIYDSYIE